MEPIKRNRSYPSQSQWRQHLSQLMQNTDHETTDDDREVNIGDRLQALRLMRGLSQRALAEKSGLNFNTLSLIENGKTSPNVSTVQQLAAALDVPVTAFFEVDGERPQVIFQKSGQRPKTDLPQGIFEDLGGGLALGEATPLLMTLRPKTQSETDPIVHTGQEFVFCLEGEFDFFVDSELYTLTPGDSLIFEAHIPHRWENSHDAAARALIIICPAEQDDRSVAQHMAEPTDLK